MIYEYIIMLAHKYFRENIVHLKENNPHLFGNFIMALKNLEESDDWPRICGIHGNTFKPNDPDVLCPTDPAIVTKLAKTGEPFYCAHSVEPFIAWHVPYIYQFECLLNKYDYSDHKEYIALPYFDITDQNADYSFLQLPSITILYNKKHVTIKNPLAGAYYYPDGVKTPTTRNGFVQATTPIQHKKLSTIRRQLYDTLHAKTYEEFSSQIVTAVKIYKPYKYVPLETPHNSIHDIIGGDGGNMSDIKISAFDPIFWLHHCNMDRFFYNWLKKVGTHYDTIFSQNSLHTTLAPFSPNCLFGWQNNTENFLSLQSVLPLDQYPYSYHPLLLQATLSTPAHIDLIDIPIPMESLTINAFLHPKNIPLSTLNKDQWYAGSVSWFGINRTVQYCHRCERVRTHLKIDILSFIQEHSITAKNLHEYQLFIEANGKLIKNPDGTYKVYSMAEIVLDGNVAIHI